MIRVEACLGRLCLGQAQNSMILLANSGGQSDGHYRLVTEGESIIAHLVTPYAMEANDVHAARCFAPGSE